MALHLLKLSVGSVSVDSLARWQDLRRACTGGLFHETRHFPRRADEILDGGSIYWVIGGFVRVRQRIADLERRASAERGRFCRIHLDPVLVRTELQPRRPHQGWRYLKPADAPPEVPADISAHGPDSAVPEEPPPAMAAELRTLGLL